MPGPFVPNFSEVSWMEESEQEIGWVRQRALELRARVLSMTVETVEEVAGFARSVLRAVFDKFSMFLSRNGTCDPVVGSSRQRFRKVVDDFADEILGAVIRLGELKVPRCAGHLLVFKCWRTTRRWLKKVDRGLRASGEAVLVTA